MMTGSALAQVSGGFIDEDWPTRREIANRDGNHVDELTFDPGSPPNSRVIRVENDGAPKIIEGWNTFRGWGCRHDPDRPPLTTEEIARLEPILAVMRFTLDCEPPADDADEEDVGSWREDRSSRLNRFLDYLAYNLQPTDKRPQWWWVLVTPGEGYGKDSLLRLVSVLFGEWNIVRVSGKQVSEGRFEWIVGKKIAVLNEARIGLAEYEELKTLITEPVKSTRMLYQNWMNARHCLIGFILTNNKNVLPISADQTRFYYVVNERPPRPNSFFDEYHRLLDDPEIVQLFMDYLMQRDLSAFEWRRLREGKTGDTQVALEETGGAGEVALREMVANRSGPFARDLVTVSSVVAELHDEHPGVVSYPDKVRQALHNAGWVTVGKDGAKTTYSHNGRKACVRMLCPPGLVERWRAANLEQRGEEVFGDKIEAVRRRAFEAQKAKDAEANAKSAEASPKPPRPGRRRFE